MASSKQYLNYVLDQLSDLDEITYRPMMGEFILYYRKKIIGGIYDNRLLVKAVPSSVRMMPNAPRELPYDGAKAELLVTEPDDRVFLRNLIEPMEPELPAVKKR